MTERCEDLDLFFDRELEPEAELVYRDHLASCTRCQEVLLGRMLEAAVVGEDRDSRPSMDPIPILGGSGSGAPAEPAPASSEDSPPPSDGPTRLHRRRILFVAAAILPAAAAAALVLWPAQRSGSRSQAVAARATAPGDVVQLAAQRFVDVRFTAPELDRYRTRSVMRAAGAAAVEQTERITLGALGALNQRTEKNALVGAYALNGDLVSAKRNADELSRTAASLADRAAVQLLEAERAAASTPVQVAAAERALSLTSDALRLEPRLPQALWNQAVALRRLGLALEAARRFDAVAALREPGWSDEAGAAARQLRSDRQAEVDDWHRVVAEARSMVLGGPVLTEAAVARAPSLARDSFYLAVATAATAARLDALAGLARTLDARSGQPVLSDLVARVRASDLKARAASADELRRYVEHHADPSEINPVRAHAVERGAHDIALAAVLALDENETDATDLAMLDELRAGSRDDWWQVVALARRAYHAEFWRRDYAAVDAIARSAEPICRVLRSRWCDRIALFAGGASSQLGRADLAIEQLTAARDTARLARLPDDETDALEQLGQAIAIRVTSDVDASAVAGAYLEEAAQHKATCRARLQGVDFATNAALQHHRFDEAERLRQATDALERGECRDARLRLNGETARLRLLLGGAGGTAPRGIAALRGDLARLEADHQSNQRLYLDFLSAGATLVEDRARGEAAVRRVLDAANARPTAAYAPVIRGSSYDVLVESAARSSDAARVLALLTERLGAPRLDRCVVGVASWNHLVVATLDGEGRAYLELRDVPEGAVMIPPGDAVSPRMRAHLAGCRRIDVLTAAPYFGAPRLLDDRAAWVYHAGAARASAGAARGHEVVVSAVAPPADLHLPALHPFSGGPGADVLSGPRATPANVLAAMKTASLAVIVAHGFSATEEPTATALVLSPDAQGDYLLTASKVRAATLAGAPIVVLAGCDAGRVQVSAEPWSLATSFLEAGARLVIAPTEPIPDDAAGEVFGSLVERIRSGADPVEALVSERSSRGAAAEWLSSIVIFE